MSYSVLALVTASTILGVAYNVVWSNELLALITMVWLLRFVFMITKLMVGISQAQISDNLDIFRASVVYLTQITAIGVLYFTEYYFVSIAAIPLVLISGCVVGMSILITLGIVEIRDK